MSDKLLLLRFLLLQDTALILKLGIQLLCIRILSFQLHFLGYHSLLVELMLLQQILILIYDHLERIRPVQEIREAR
ncbi:hypothetical protein D3C80_1949990 [compost metagenome]